MDLASLAKEKYGYSAFLLSEESRNHLLSTFKPKYEKIIAEHITYKFKVTASSAIPNIKEATVIGHADSGDGLEALIVDLGDQGIKRPDGSIYHITWSLTPGKYKPVDSNTLIKERGYQRTEPLKINIIPTFIPFH